MSQKNFEPITNIFAISRTNLYVQLGLISSKVAIILFREKEIINLYIFKDLRGKELPMKDELIRWILNTIPLSINHYQIDKIAVFLLRQDEEALNKKKYIVPLEDTKKKKLENVPDSELRRPKNPGWVIKNEPIKRDENQYYTICPFCGSNINKCPKCGRDLIE